VLGRVIRDVSRKIATRPELAAVLALPLSLARRVRYQRRRERGRKVYSLHAPEVECIGKGKAHKPYEFGVKVSVATPLHRCAGGQFVAHVQALPGNPYDGHTLGAVIPEIERTLGAELMRVITDAGYKGHSAPQEKRFRVYVAGQKRGLSAAIKRAFRRRAAVEPTIGHLKGEHRMGRNDLAGSKGDAINAVLAAVGYNFRLMLRWLAFLCAVLRVLLAPTPSLLPAHHPA
jgi:IS5 family transposase